MVYDVTNKESFQNIEKWLLTIIQYIPNPLSFPVVVIANKIDLPNRLVSTAEGEVMTKSLRKIIKSQLSNPIINSFESEILYFESSAKFGNGVQDAFYTIAKKVDIPKYEFEVLESIDVNQSSLNFNEKWFRNNCSC